MPGPLHCLPSRNKTPSATLSWSVSSADPLYPIANAATLESDVVAKAQATTATLRATFGGAQALEGVIAINTNWPGLTVPLTNNGGMVSQGRVVPSPEDDLQVNVFWDLREVASASAAQWEIAVSGAPGNVTIGTLILVESWEALKIKWGYGIRETHPVITKVTSHKKKLRYRIPVRYRAFTGTPFWAEDRALMRTLRRETHGPFTPFGFVPDEEDLEAFLVQFSEKDAEETYEFVSGRFDDTTEQGNVPMPIELEEVSGGVSLL